MLVVVRPAAHHADPKAADPKNKSKVTIMKHLANYKLILAATLGLACAALTAHAQLMVNLREQATFAPFVGGGPNAVTNNGAFNTQEVITTGMPIASPFTITYTPLTGPSNVTLGTGTLNTATFDFHSPISPTSYFTSLGAAINYDFDNDGTIDLSQSYTINLAPFVSGAFTGVSYSIVPNQYFGSVTINGTLYSYASAVANSAGILFDGGSTQAVVQFQFLSVPVPEPSTYALCGVAALGGITWLRRRRSQLRSIA